MIYGNYFLNEISLPKIVVPKYLYHGSAWDYKYLLASGIDFGNSFQKPGWSLFTWTKKESAYGWAIFALIKEKIKKYFNYERMGCLLSQTTVLTTDSYNSLLENLDKIPKEEKTFYIYTIETNSKYEYGLGHSSNTPNCITLRTRERIPIYKKDKIILTKELIDTYTVIRDDTPTEKEYGYKYRFTSFLMNNDFMNTGNSKIRQQIRAAVKNGELQPGDDIIAYMKANNLKL